MDVLRTLQTTNKLRMKTLVKEEYSEVTPCIDLKKQFGSCYRIKFEEGYVAERGQKGRSYDPWLVILLCQHGHIYPHGRGLLGASTNYRGSIAKRLSALPCVRVIQDGDDGINVVFRLEDFHAVADLLKPKRRRQLSAEHRQRLADMGKASLKAYRQANVQHAGKGRRRDPTTTKAPNPPNWPTAPNSASEFNPTLHRRSTP
jgi:hypothetical protein